MPIRDALFFPSLLLAGAACLVGACSDEPGPAPTAASSAPLRLAYLELGMSQPLADDCSALALLTRPPRDPAVQSEDPPSSDPLLQTRAAFLQVYCDEYAPPGNYSGWEACIEGNSALTRLKATPGCVDRVQPYLECLARADTDSREDCRAVQPVPSCDPTVPLRSGSAASLWCAAGQFGFDGIDCEPHGQEHPCTTAFNQDLSECGDGGSYQFLCLPPDAACSTRCSCSKDGVATRDVTLAGVRDAEFVEQVWIACGFPEIPAALMARWRAELPTTSVYDPAPE